MIGLLGKKQASIGLVSVVLILLAASRAQALPLLTENFDSVGALPGAGWAFISNSVPPGTTGWFQGNQFVFAAQAGAPDAYIAANFNNAALGGDISNWLLTPQVTLDNGELFSFFTRTAGDFPDRLEIRMSTNGASANVGAGATGVGDFSNLLLSINPALEDGIYPTSWTQYDITLSGLAFPTSGRLGFRYYVGDTLVNADFIGIDTVSLAAAEPTAVPEPSTLTMLGVGALGVLRARRRRQAGH